MEQLRHLLQAVDQARPWAAEQVVVERIDGFVLHGCDRCPTGPLADRLDRDALERVAQDDDIRILFDQFL